MLHVNTWWTMALASAGFAALTAILAKLGVKNVDPDLATAVRTVVILVIAWGIVLVKGGASQLTTLSWQNGLFLVLSGLATGLSWVCYFRALQLGNVSQVAPLDKCSLLLTMLLAVLILGETLTWKTALGGVLIFVGALLLIR